MATPMPASMPFKTGAKRPRISRPVELLRHEYDVVVIGSGYGAGVAASRMSRGRQSVCVLERGKERWPGEYPTNMKEALPEFHVSGDFHPTDHCGIPVDGGNPTGLYHLITGSGQNAFVANGLGGTSLLNANVFLEADDRTMAMEEWPEELRSPESLKKYYKRASDMLEPAEYPKDYPQLRKTQLLEKQAKALGLGDKFRLVPQTTKFRDGPNSSGVEMHASTLTGQDSTGVNDGSKTTTLVTYLSDAWNWGAEIFCEIEVRYIKKHPKGGYLVFFAWHGCSRTNFKANFEHDLMWVHARKAVFLGAGAIGTTEIMLRSKQYGLRTSDLVGENMSGNGDMLAFGYNMDDYVNAIGRERPEPSRPIGPTITSVIDCRDEEDHLDGFVVQEGAVPAALSKLMQPMLQLLPRPQPPSHLSAAQVINKLLSRCGSYAFGPYYHQGAVEKTQIYLIMSHDMNQATLTLKDNKPSLEFLGVGRANHLQKLNALMADMTNREGGTFVNNPFYAKLNEQEITVHPIGGMNLSSDGTANRGATTHLGEVLTGHGSEYHNGLIVVDGALVPTALGVNPFATITALAERCVEGIADKNGIDIDYETKNGKNGILDIFGLPEYPLEHNNDPLWDEAERTIATSQAAKADGFVFTEVMDGFIHIGDDIKNFDVAADYARSENADARFFLSVRAWDTNSITSTKDHRAMLTGTFSNGMPGSPFMVLRGNFQLFNADPDAPEQTNLTYDFDMVGTDGSMLHFHGKKLVNPSAAFSIGKTWIATSTLYVTLTQPDGSIAGKGILNIGRKDLLRELAAISATGVTEVGRFRSGLNFFSYFAQQVARVFFVPFTALQWPSPASLDLYNHTSPSGSLEVVASDDVVSTLLRWEPTGRSRTGRVIDILFVPGAAVDHQIFALPTIKTNAIDFFSRAGYRCWCVTHRVGKNPAARDGYTTFDARHDVRAALEAVRAYSPTPEKIYVIAHCAGSVALASGLLDGTIPPAWIRGITASNVFMHPQFAHLNSIKAHLPVPLTSTYGALAGPWFDCVSQRGGGGSFVQKVLNQALRFYPVDSAAELCTSVTCHRASLAFGRLWSHRNLNKATHDQLHEFLGGTSMACLSHLVDMGSKGEALDNNRRSLVTEENMERLRGLPILLFSGTENAVFSEAATLTSYTALRVKFDDPKGLERIEFFGRGHLDCWMSDESAVRGGVFDRVRRTVDDLCSE